MRKRMPHCCKRGTTRTHGELEPTCSCPITSTYFALRRLVTCQSSSGSRSGNAAFAGCALPRPDFNRADFTIVCDLGKITARNGTTYGKTLFERDWSMNLVT